MQKVNIAGWSSLVARRAHNPKVVGSNPAPATTKRSEISQNAFLLSVSDTKKGLLHIVLAESAAAPLTVSKIYTYSPLKW